MGEQKPKYSEDSSKVIDSSICDSNNFTLLVLDRKTQIRTGDYILK